MRVYAGGSTAPADIDPNTFAPTGYDPDSWLDAAATAGAKYALIQTKHHDGFCMWPTAYAAPAHNPYSIAETTWYANNGNPDVVGDLVDSCRSHGIAPCLYFSAWDLTYEARTGTDETSDAAAYIAMIEAQLSELLTNYGAITAIWIDGWKWHLGYTAIPFATIYNYIKAIQPNCLVIDNNQEHPLINGDLEIWEAPVAGSIPAGNVYLSEEVDTIRNDGKWVYNPGDDVSDASLKSAATINAAIANAVANYGTYLLAVQPGPDGVLPAATITKLASVVVP